MAQVQGKPRVDVSVFGVSTDAIGIFCEHFRKTGNPAPTSEQLTGLRCFYRDQERFISLKYLWGEKTNCSKSPSLGTKSVDIRM